MPPVIVEVQNTVDNVFICRLEQYCSHVYHRHNNVDPIALTLCVKTVRTEIANQFEDSKVASLLKVLPSKYWAQQHFILAPITIQGELREKDQMLHPLVAIQYVFQRQERSVHNLESNTIRQSSFYIRLQSMHWITKFESMMKQCFN